MFAYFDAGTGSMLLSAVAAGAAGIALFFSTGWQRVKSRFGGGSSTAATDEDALDGIEGLDDDLAEIDDAELNL